MPPDEPNEPGLFTALWSWCEAHPGLIGWLFVGSLASLVLVALLLPVIVVRLDPDYFLTSRREHARRGGPVYWGLLLGKNLLGFLFLFAGFLMLFLPGQGLLTILIGLLLADFPGKRTLERRLVARPAILAFLNRMRARRGRSPLLLDAPAPAPRP
ncbi:MAG: hypothetical protein FJ265_19270 [Planctomycetes bacterium]|nr:hypothetical protein [Planctomycetota bacterium]